MAKAGDVTENPVTGERMVFLKTARDTGGELLQFDHFLKIGGFGPPEHIHPYQEERFKVITGKMGVRLNGREHTLGEGDEIAVPPGEPHTWWNVGDVELHQVTEFRPALKFEVFAQTLAALGRERSVYKGLPLIMQFAVLVAEYPNNVYVSSAPVIAQKLAFPILSLVGRPFGYYTRYLEYRVP